LKIPKVHSDTVKDKTMQWPKGKWQKDKQWSTKHYTEN